MDLCLPKRSMAMLDKMSSHMIIAERNLNICTLLEMQVARWSVLISNLKSNQIFSSLISFRALFTFNLETYGFHSINSTFHLVSDSDFNVKNCISFLSTDHRLVLPEKKIAILEL